MDLKTIEGFQYAVFESDGDQARCIYLLGLPPQEEDLTEIFAGLGCPVVYIVISDWDNQLTPWPAKGLYHQDPDFKGEAPQFLEVLTKKLIPVIEKEEGLTPDLRALAGYSLAGLFSVYAFANSAKFECVASMSGSFWYERWTSYITSLDRNKQGCSAFFSLGERERKAKEKILHRVQENTEVTIETLESWGVQVQYHLVPGGHFDNIYERIREGLAFLAKALEKHESNSQRSRTLMG